MADGYDSYDPIQKWGKGSGLYKTTDGGQSFKKLTKGLPTNNLGRIGIEYYRKNPDTVFVIVDCEKIGMGTPPRSGASVYMDISAEDAEGGVRVTGIRENGPSAKAGLLVDDLIQTVNDERITSREKLEEVFREHKIGDKLRLKVLRGLNQLEIIVTLDRRPETSSVNVYLGLSGEDSEEGAKVTSVIPEGPAEKAGLRADDIVQSINDKPVTSYNQLLEEVRSRNAGDKVKIKITREGQSQEIEVTLGERPPGQGGFRGQGGLTGRRTPPPTTGPYAGINGEEAEGGIRLTTIADNSPAAKAGLKSGDIVTSAEGKELDKYEELVELIRAHKPGDKLDLKIKSGEASRDVALTLADRSQVATTRPSFGNLGGQIENVQDEQGPNSHEYGGIYKSTDGGETWKRINSFNPRPMYFSNIKVDPKDERFIYVCGVNFYKSTDGGKTFRPDAGKGVHADQHALWIDQRDPRHMLVGCDGGFYSTYDRTANWDHLNTVAIGQFYHVAICPQQPYHVTGGLQDNGSWCGPTVSLDGSGPINENWISVGGGDGFVCRVDWNDPDVIYSESQNGAIQRRNIRTGERASIRPPRADGAPAYRFNWNTPFILSNHNSRILYSAGNHVFRSLDRGNNLQVISPDITLTKWGSATALTESPKNPDLLYVGTDDGALWITRDGGKSWTNIAKNVGLPALRWVATIEPSRFVEGRAYVAFDGHRSDDDEPYVYLTEDFGKTWTSIRASLPSGSSRCLREDISNPNLLYLGTEFGAWCSLDRGKSWNKLGANLPTVAVHEFAIHPTAGEIVAATHGRSLWVLDVSALRQLKPDQLAATPVLYQPSTTMRWRSQPAHGRTNRRFNGQNPTLGAQIYYSLPKAAEKVSIKILDIAGNTLRELPGRKDPGLNRVTWDLRPVARSSPPTTQPNRMPEERRSTTRPFRSTTRPAIAPPQRAGMGESSGGGPQQRFGGLPPVPAGSYRIVLSVDGKEFAQTLRVDADPVVADSTMASNESELDENEEEEEEMERQEQVREIRQPAEID
jgi:S1-C subfamily serine protease